MPSKYWPDDGQLYDVFTPDVFYATRPSNRISAFPRYAAALSPLLRPKQPRSQARSGRSSLQAKHDRPILSSKKGADPRGPPRFRSCPLARIARRIVGLLTCGLRSLRPCLHFRGVHQRLRLRGMSLVCEGLGAVCDGRGVGGPRPGCPGEDFPPLGSFSQPCRGASVVGGPPGGGVHLPPAD